MRKNKNKKMFLMLLLIIGISIGYAALASNLKINGGSKVTKATWNIHWANPQVKEGSVTNTKPTLSENNTNATYSVTLTEPGDFYEFTIDAVNEGTIDAEILKIESRFDGPEGTPIITEGNDKNLPPYLEYEVTYADTEHTAIAPTDSLDHGQTKTYRVRIAYSENIDADDLKDNDITTTFYFEVEYKQKDKNNEDSGQEESTDDEITLNNPTEEKKDNDTTYYTENWVNANEIYYDPTIPAVCTKEEYEANTTDVLTNSGCMKWYAFSTKNGKTKLILDHNLYLGTNGTSDNTTYWISDDDFLALQNGTKTSTNGITFVNTIDSHKTWSAWNFYGPQTALNILGISTNHWKTKTYGETYTQQYTYEAAYEEVKPNITIDYSNYKAILLNDNEVRNYGKYVTPSFFKTNISNSTQEYWTATPVYDDDTGDYMAKTITSTGGGTGPINADIGLRPVIIVPSKVITE